MNKLNNIFWKCVETIEKYLGDDGEFGDMYVIVIFAILVFFLVMF
jgi:hypothetical protein